MAAGKKETSSYGAAAAATVVVSLPPTNVQVIAPATLEAGYSFDAMYEGVTFRVIVPEGGISRGQRFIVPFVPSTSSSLSSEGEGGGGGGGGKGRRRRGGGGGIPRGIWRDGLCDCCKFGIFHPHYLFALFLKPILLGQLLTRMKMTYIGRRTNVSDDGTTLLFTASNLNDSRVVVDDRWRNALRDVVIVTAVFLAVAAATSTPDDRGDDNDNDDDNSRRDRRGKHDDRSSYTAGADEVMSTIHSCTGAIYGFYITYVIVQLRATMRHVYSIPEENCLCMYRLGLFGNDPREGVCGGPSSVNGCGCCPDPHDDGDGDNSRWWCTSGVPVGWEDVCCAMWCQFCILGQMARHTVDYGERRAACCSGSGVSDWDDDEAYEGVESGHVGEGSVLVV